MSLVLRLTTPTAVEHDLADPANVAFGVDAAEELGDLEQRVEDELNTFHVGELDFTCHNDGGWWDTLFAGADRLARWPDTFSLEVERAGTVRWVGDIDLSSVAFDRSTCTVSFRVAGQLARLTQYSAEAVRRGYPTHSDWGGTSTVDRTLTLGTNEDDSRVVVIDPAGEYAYVGLLTTAGVGTAGGVAKVRLADMARVGVLTFSTGETLVNAAAIDPAGEFLYVGCYTSPARIVKVRLSDFSRVGALSLGTGNDYTTDCCISADGASLYVSCFTDAGRVVKVTIGTFAVAGTCTLLTGENSPTCIAVDPTGATVYAGLYLTPGRVAKIQTSDMTRIDVLTLSSGDSAPQALVMDAGGTKLYIACETIPGRIAEVTLSSFTRTAFAAGSTGENSFLDVTIDSTGASLYASCGTSAGRVVQFTRSALARSAGLELSSGFNLAYGLDWDAASSTLVLSAGITAAQVVRVATIGGLVQCAAVACSGKAWASGALVNHVLIAGSAVYVIVANGAAAAVVAGNPDAGSFEIRPSAWSTAIATAARKMTSLGPSIATLDLAVGDKLTITRVGGSPSRLVYNPKRGFYYQGTYEADQQTVEITHVGPSSYPSLSAQQIIVDADLDSDLDLGDHVACITPYHRSLTVAELVAALFTAAGVDAGDTVVEVPSFANAVIPYADFEGLNVAEALGKLAEICCCTLAATPDTYLFTKRDAAATGAGYGGSLDLITTEHAEQLIADTSYDCVRVTGAGDRVLIRGAVSHLADPLDIESDWIDDYQWLKQVGDRAWEVFGGRRRGGDVTILDGMRRNLVADPSFEGLEAVNATACQWKLNAAPGSGEVCEKSGERAGHLTQALKVLAAASGAGMGVKQQLTGWTAGETIYIAAKALIARTAGTLHLDLYGKNSGGSVVLDSSSTYWNADTAGAWVEKAATVVIPATCTELWVRIFVGSGAHMTAYVDAVRVEPVTGLLAPELLQRVTLGNEPYLVWSCREPLRSSEHPETIELGLLGLTLTAADGAYDAVSEDATPPQPLVDHIDMTGYETSPSIVTNYAAYISWPFPDAPVARLLLTVWNTAGTRPDTPTAVLMPLRDDAETFLVTFLVSEEVTTDEKFMDVTILYADGRMSDPSPPATLPPSIP